MNVNIGYIKREVPSPLLKNFLIDPIPYSLFHFPYGKSEILPHRI
jgi:hypothetical protein